MSSKQQHRLITGAAPISPGVSVTGEPNNDSAYVTTDGGMCIEVNPFLFWPKEGSFQALAIGAASVRSTALTDQKVIWIWATAPCHIRLTSSSGNAALTDFPFPANVVMELTPYTAGGGPFDKNYLAVRQLSGSALTGFLYLGQARR